LTDTAAQPQFFSAAAGIYQKLCFQQAGASAGLHGYLYIGVVLIGR